MEFTFEAPVVKVDDTDFAASGDWTPAAGDVKVSKDGGNVANIGTLPTAVGGTGSVLWTWTLSATEMQAKRVTIQVVDAALENQAFIVQTHGNASAQHAVDLDDAVRAGLTALPNAAADAAGGLPISDAGGLDLDTMNSNVSAILTDTAEIGAAGAGLTEAGGTGDHLTAVPWNAAWDAEVQSECTDALNAYDPPTNAEMEARTLVAASYATATALATVDTVVDAVKVETDKLDAARTEPTGVPASNESPLTKLDYVFMTMRNKKTVSATKKTIFDAAGAAEFEYDLTDNGTTYTESEANAI
ncbi:MAG: hypothetical protein QNJ92_17360 [Alphaproteobacteria bacterium]|nr:hypothetical protein [Alphaproteobacteria bacterium]